MTNRYCHKCQLSGDACLSCVFKEEWCFYNNHIAETYDPIYVEPTEPEQCTHLSEEDEDKLRIALCNIFNLRPAELLCLQAIMTNQTLTQFAESLTKFVIKLYGQIDKSEDKQISRHYVFKLRESICNKYPDLKPALITNGQRKQLK